jgi:ribonuclease D
LCKDLAGIEISKQQQTSDWGSPDLTPEQLAYAASDVLYLHAVWAKLEFLLRRENRLDLAMAAYAFLPTRAQFDLLGYNDPDIFSH